MSEPAGGSEGRTLRHGVTANTIRLANSAVAFTIALMVMITVHEFGHALPGLLIGLHPTVFPGAETNGIPGTSGQQVLTAMAGPVVSLVTGLIVLLLSPVPRGFAGLLLFWFGTLSVQEFTGYLMTGPFLRIGDVGQALHLLSSPLWAYVLVFLVGVGGTVLLGRFATRRLLAMTEPGAGDRSRQLRSLGLFAWLLGAILFTLAGVATGGTGQLFTAVGLVELLATFTSGIFIFLVRFFMGKEQIEGQGLSLGLRWPIAGVVVLALLAVARQLILGPGLHL